MTEQPKTAQVADGAFVHAVGELYRLAIRTRPWDTGVSVPAAINALQLGGAYASLSEDDKFQARVVVIGLVTIDRALEFLYADETNPTSGECEDPPSTPPVGLLCASQLLNALLRRSSDSAWRYISALRIEPGVRGSPCGIGDQLAPKLLCGIRPGAAMGRREGWQ
jgi:hypothetical protein